MSLVGRYLSLIKFEHTLFAMPFALISLLVASDGRPPLRALVWVVAAMVGARTAAMAFNRLADRHLDAGNPRTADRHLPAGTVSPAGAAALTVLGAALLVLAAGMLNRLCLVLSPVALAVVLGYSFMKRISAAAHLVLGLGLAIAPVGAWLAVRGSFAAFPLWLAGGVLFWVAGFDTIYGIQDADYDRRVGLHSLASRLGVGRALLLSRIFHVLAIAGVAGAFRRAEALGPVSLLGVAVMAGLLAWEQAIVQGGDMKHIDKAFFTINSWVGMVLLGIVLVDLYLV
ncbi:MAG TPA: UbiA-like polyprenyltransferase [Candidatus Krumholzibacteria bacterium]|nr:UbiA-like polyprenyltransferase [Candidatus Krumholzibacteria bacterium]